MKQSLAKALGALMLLAAANSAAWACATKDELIDQLAHAIPNATLTMVGEMAAARMAVGIAALIGGEVQVGGEYALIDLPASQQTYVVRFAGGCATHQGRFPSALVQGWLSGAAKTMP